MQKNLSDCELSFNKLRAKKLVSLSELIQAKCPGLARFYMSKAQKIAQHSNDPLSMSWKTNWCSWCGNLYSPENIKVRLVPKMPLTTNIKKLLKRFSKNPHSIGKHQSYFVNKYLNTKNKIRIICQICKKSRKISGKKRDFDSKQKKFVSNCLNELVNLRLKKKKKKNPEESPGRILNSSLLSNDSPLLTSTPSLSNVSLSSTHSKWESFSTPLISKQRPQTPGNQKNSSQKIKHLKKLLNNQKSEEEEDSLTSFLDSVS